VILAAVLTIAVMLVVVFARRLSAGAGLAWLAPAGALAWPWYVPLGTALTVGVGLLSSLRRSPPQSTPAREAGERA
jgi:hypothetical protein